MTNPLASEHPLARIEGLLNQLLLAVQHQSIEVARLQDELAALRQTQRSDTTRLYSEICMVGKRSDWFAVQISDVLRVTLRELREVRATQVFSAVTDGPISAQLLADLIHRAREEDLLLELPIRS